MRITLCNALYPTPSEPNIVGGAEVLVRQLAEGLVEAGNQVAVVRASRDGRLRAETVNGVDVHFLPIRNLFPPFEDKRTAPVRLAWHVIDDRWQPPRALRRLLAEFKPDVVHSHTLNGLSTGLWDVAHRLGIPVVHTLHDYYLTCPRCSRFKNGKSCDATCCSCDLLTRVRRKRAHRVDAVTSISQRTLHIHQQHGALDPSTPVHIIRNVASPAIAPSELVPLRGPLKVGYIGRFAEEKGVSLLVEAVGRLPAGSVELILAGRVADEERRRLQALAPNVAMRFLGFASPVDFYRRVHVTVAPAIWEEPASLVVQDALAAACPPIVTAIGGAPESIRHGVTGWLVKPTVEALDAQLRALVDRPDLVAAARDALLAEAGKRRTVADLVADYQAVYREVAAKRLQS